MPGWVVGCRAHPGGRDAASLRDIALAVTAGARMAGRDEEVGMALELSTREARSDPAAALDPVGDGPLPAAMRLQILTTEHWSLLATRSLSWNEAFSRASMFLSALSGAVVALALVAQAMSFGQSFVTFAVLILPVVLFLGIATHVRLVEINHEDVRWVVGMNLLRQAYLAGTPELRQFFITGWHDDEAGIMATFGAKPGPGALAHEFVTTPGVLAVIDGVIAGILIAIAAGQAGVASEISVGAGVLAGVVTVCLLVTYQYRGSVRPRGRRRARFPEPATGAIEERD